MEDKDELISIIVPVYNAENVIEKCVQSLLEQTYRKIEIILVNDGSTDESLHKCNGLADKDKRVKVITQKNGGVSMARNKGMENATGTYIGFVDADDWVESTMYEELYKTLIRSKADIILCNYIQVYKNQYYERDEFKNINEDVNVSKNIILSEILSRHKDNIMGVCWRLLISKEMLNANNLIFDVGVKMSEDMMFVIKCVECAKNICLNRKFLYYYYMNENSVTAKYLDNMWYDMMLLIKWCNNNIVNKYSDEKILNSINECIANAVILELGNVCKNNSPLKFKDRILYCNNLINDNKVKNAINIGWKNRSAFHKKIWIQLVCLKMNMKFLVILYHSFKHKTIFS